LFNSYSNINNSPEVFNSHGLLKVKSVAARLIKLYTLAVNEPVVVNSPATPTRPATIIVGQEAFEGITDKATVGGVNADEKKKVLKRVVGGVA